MFKFTSSLKILIAFGLLLFSLPLAAQYGWNFQYTANNAATNWRHLSAGDSIAIAGFTFSRDNPADPKSYYLKGFRLWPITNAGEWFVDSLQLYMDRGNRVFSADDSLISSGLIIDIPDQTDSTNSISFDFGGDSLALVDNRMLIVVAVVRDWHDEDPENLEVDTTAAGPYNKWFSIKVFKEDLTVSPEVMNSISSPAVVQFGYQTLNMPVTVRNNLASTVEDDSAKLNMFYPNYLALNNSAASKAQRIDDLSFYADIFLPESNDSIELSLKSASLQFGFDNRVLEFISVEYGDVWGDDAWFYVDTSLTQVELFDETHPEYTVFQYDAEFNGSAAVNNIYDVISNSSIIRLKFNIIGPGVSPIFIQNLDLYDRWGIRYHCYQQLQNYATPENGGTTERYDAWAKYVLGDYTFSGGEEISTDGIGDGRVTWEDISLFSDYFWQSPSSSTWTKRFDIGSAESVSPSQYSPDDTTNFYDLMVMGTNYRRSYEGIFNQKQTVIETAPVEVFPIYERADEKLSVRIAIKNAADLQAAHVQLRFDPGAYRFETVKPGDWLDQQTPQRIFLVPEERIAQGSLDMNFVSLGNSLAGEGEFAEIQLCILDPEAATPEITDTDLRDSNCRSMMTSLTPKKDRAVADMYTLLSNYPNPFNADTRIRYAIPESSAGIYQLTLLDIRGTQLQTLVNRYQAAGTYQLHWDGTDQSGQAVASGVYFLNLQGPQVNVVRKIMLLR